MEQLYHITVFAGSLKDADLSALSLRDLSCVMVQPVGTETKEGGDILNVLVC